jgi:iron-sulfur cluster repair protein YtfE (RIC family)
MDFIAETSPNAEGEARVARFQLIHDLIRRDLALILELAERVGTAPRQTVRDQVVSLTARSPIWSLQTGCLQHCRFVRGHHLHEDQSWFPRLLRVNPALNPAVQRLKREHEAVAERLGRIERHARAIDRDPDARASLSAELTELARYLLAHLDWEENAIFPTIRRMADFAPQP